MPIRSAALRVLFAIVIAVSIGACAKPESKIIGKWRMDENKTIEFFPDKTLILVTPITNISGVYSFVTKDRMKIEFSGMIGLAGPQIVKVSFEQGDLVMEADESSSLFAGHHVLKRIGG